MHALNKSYTTSITIKECWDELRKIDINYKWSIQWIKGHSGIKGNENADTLAKKAANTSGEKQISFQRLAPEHINKALKKLTVCNWSEYWANRPDCRQTKLWFPLPDPKKSAEILNLNREDFGLSVRWLTGHCYLKRHQALLHGGEGICFLCDEADETPWHLLTECPATIHKFAPQEDWNVKSLMQKIYRLRFLEIPEYAELLSL